MARPIPPSVNRFDARAAQRALQDYLVSWARELTVVVGGRPRRLTRTEVQRLSMQARPRVQRRGMTRVSRVEGVLA